MWDMKVEVQSHYRYIWVTYKDKMWTIKVKNVKYERKEEEKSSEAHNESVTLDLGRVQS